jgi:tol-pal system protein YbgF
MNKKTPAVVAAFVAAMFLPGPALAQNREHQQMASDVRMLQEQTQLLAQSIAQTLTRLGELGESLKKIETRLDAAEAANRRTIADQKLTLDSLSADLRIVREGTQNVNTRIGRLSEEVEALRTTLPSLVAQSAPPPDPTALAPGDAAPGIAAAAAAAAPAPTSPTPRSGLSSNRLFQAAMADYTAGNYTLAISGFQQLLTEWSNSEYADDAQYYIGQSHLAQKRNADAIKAFNEVIQKYPTGDKAPEAYFYLGQTHRTEGDVESARATWMTLMARFPGSDSAIMAKQRLSGLPPSTTSPKP